MELISVALLLLFATVPSRSEVVDLNDSFDKNIVKIQDYLRHQSAGGGSFTLPNPRISDKYSFVYTTVIGIDSAERTGDCSMTKDGHKYRYDCHVGLRLLALVFSHVRYNGEDMSAIVRIRNNSLHLSFTEDKTDGKCLVTVDDLKVESLNQVEVTSSMSKYDGENVEELFEDFRKWVNNLIDKFFKELNEPVTAVWCKIGSDDPDVLFKNFETRIAK